MNKRFIGVLIFAFVVASVASLMLYRLLLNRPQSAKAAQSAVQIVLATRDIEVGTVLKEDDVRLSDWPAAVPMGAAGKTQDVVGRGVTTPIFAKEPVIDSRLAPKGAGGGLAAMIPPGMRAVAIRVNEVVGVAGFVTPGMRVDVLISGTRPGGGDGRLGTLTKTLLQNLEVLSAGTDFKKDAEGKPVQVQVVNMLVTPEQAEQLSLANSQTQIQLVLRNPLDHEVAKTAGTAVGLLFSGGKLKAPAGDAADEPAPAASAPAAAAARPRRAATAPKAVAAAPAAAPAPKKEGPFVMEIISGNRKAETKFAESVEGK
jgi:pilus assembly protein CpaB